MRKVFLVDHDFPPTEADMAAAAAAGAAEVVCGIPEALARDGVASFGYHELPDPPAAVPDSVEMRKAQLEMLATPWPAAGAGASLLDAVEALVGQSPRAIQIEWAKADRIHRRRDLVVAMQAGFGIADTAMDQLFRAAAARP